MEKELILNFFFFFFFLSITNTYNLSQMFGALLIILFSTPLRANGNNDYEAANIHISYIYPYDILYNDEWEYHW